jgi:hypothetical protein
VELAKRTQRDKKVTQRKIADKPRQYWSRVEQRLLRRLYPDTSTMALARQLGRSVSAVYGMAATFGLRKSDAYLASPKPAVFAAVTTLVRALASHVPIFRLTRAYVAPDGLPAG